jgi:hypothetical protein
MAIYPEKFPEERNNEIAEKTVYEKMQKLPEYFDIFYNQEFSGRNDGEKFDYEIDFIVADLRNNRFNGVVCIEVKGGILRCAGNNSWTQNGKKISSPPLQALSGIKNLMNIRYREMERKVCTGWMVCFPDSGETGNEKLPTGLEENQLIGKLKLAYLKETLLSFFDERRKKSFERTGLDINHYNNFFKAPLIRSCDFILPLSSRIKADEVEFIRMTEKQSKTFRKFQFNDRILVRGIAGSGKTLIAKEVAQEFFEKGLNILFLCYNKVLANNIECYYQKGSSVTVRSYLNDIDIDYDDPSSRETLAAMARRMEELRNRSTVLINEGNVLRVERYHSFAYSVIESADPGWWRGHIGKLGSSYFWGEAVPFKLMEMLEKGEIAPEYDAIIIDEGQDFSEDWLSTAKYFMKPDGKFYVFIDTLQNIYQNCPRIPALKEFSIAVLDENCRNTRKIASRLSEIIELEINSMPGMPEGEDVAIVKYRSDTEQQAKILQKIRELIGDGIRPNQILILLNTLMERSCLAQTKKIDRHALQKLGSVGVLSDNHINYAHISSFKGLEADIVFIIDTDKVKSYDEKLLYTQASRAKYKLYIFEKSE